MNDKAVTECLMTVADLCEHMKECIETLEDNQTSPAQPEIVITMKRRLIDLGCDFGDWENAPILDRIEEAGLLPELYAIAREVLR